MYSSDSSAVNSLNSLSGEETGGNGGFPKWLLAVMAVFACAMIVWQWAVCRSMGMLSDYFDYLDAWHTLTRHYPHITRPPLYPLLLGVTTSLLGETAGHILLVALNWIIWMIGCRLSWSVMAYFGVNRVLRISVIFLLMLFSGSWVYNNNLLPEALCQGMVPLLIWQAIRFVRTRRTVWIVYTFLTALALVFLKPQFISLFPVLALVWGIAVRRNRHQLLVLSCSLVLSAGLVSCYAWTLRYVYSLSGTISVSTYWNRYCTLRMAGLIHTDEIRDSQARHALAPLIQADPGQYNPEVFMYEYELQRVSSAQLQEIVDNVVRRHPAAAAKAFARPLYQELGRTFFPRNWHERMPRTAADTAYYQALGWDYRGEDPRCFRHGGELFMTSPEFKGSAISPTYGLSFPFWISWLVIILFTGRTIGGALRSRRRDMVPFLMAGILIAGYVTAFVGAMGDWGRLVNPYTMLLLCAAGVLLTPLLRIIRKYHGRYSSSIS